MTKRMQKILLGFSLLLAVPFVVGYGLYYGYCHSWWGKDNLLFRSLWLCSCPAGFEETLYPDYVEVAFSACNEVRLFHVFPDDRYLLVDNDESRPGMPRYFWDPITDERIPLNLSFDIWSPISRELQDILFLDENTYIDRQKFPHNVITVREGKSTPLKSTNDTQIAIYLEDGITPNPEAVKKLYPVEGTKIFIKDNENNISVIIVPPIQSEFAPESIMDKKEDGTWILEVLEYHQIPYQTYLDVYPAIYEKGLLSPNSLYLAKSDGIYNPNSAEKIFDPSEVWAGTSQEDFCTDFYGCPLPYEPCCWQSDNQAVFYALKRDGIRAVEFPIPGRIEDVFETPIFKINIPTDHNE